MKGAVPAAKAAGLLLAAGASRRMGRPKQLLDLGGHTLLERALSAALASTLDRVVLVLGHEASLIRRALGSSLEHARLEVIENPDHAKGISTSIIAGLRAVEASHDHVVVLLADMPGINAALIDLLLERYLASGAALGSFRAAGRPSHPVVFGRRLYPELHRLQGDRGARHLFRRFHEQVCWVAPPEAYVDSDLDTPADYERFKRDLAT